MNLKKALKEKKKLQGIINNLEKKIIKYNLIEDGEDNLYNTRLLYDELRNRIEEIVFLKSKIHAANVPIFDKIFRLSELKSLARMIQYFNCEPRKEINGTVVNKLLPVINALDRDIMVKNIETEIEDIHDFLDNYNQLTLI